MLKFKTFIIEKLEGDLGNHETGTLHEILIAKHLNDGKHVNPEAEKIHDEYVKRIGGTSSVLYNHHLERAKFAADTIKNKVEEAGHTVSHATWTPRAAEKEKGHADPSDIYVHTTSGKSIGVSLKVGDKHGEKPISNPGILSQSTKHLTNARQAVADAHPHTKGMTVKELKQEAKTNPEVAKTVNKLRNETLKKSVNDLHAHYSSMNHEELHNNVMKLLHAGPHADSDHMRVTTTGVHGKYKSRAVSPSTHYDEHIQPGKIAVEKSGTSVIFKHKDTGKTLARHRLKFESSGLTSIKGSGESSL